MWLDTAIKSRGKHITNHSYYVVMVDYGKRGLEAVVQPEITRREVISRIASGEYQRIVFIHHVDGLLVEDVTGELIDAAEQMLREREEA